jgi:hypothetical protein
VAVGQFPKQGDRSNPAGLAEPVDDAVGRGPQKADPRSPPGAERLGEQGQEADAGGVAAGGVLSNCFKIEG